MNYHLEYFRARETSLIGYLKLSSFFSFLFSSLLLFFLFSFLSRSTAAPLDYRIDDRKRRISRAYELLHSIPLINHSLRLYYHDHAKSMETRYALFISITSNFFSLFNINTIFFYSFSSFFFPLFFFFLLYTHITSGDISGSLSYLFSLSTLLYSDLLVRFYNSARPRISNRMNISWYLASFSVLQRVWLR